MKRIALLLACCVGFAALVGRHESAPPNSIAPMTAADRQQVWDDVDRATNRPIGPEERVEACVRVAARDARSAGATVNFGLIRHRCHEIERVPVRLEP